MRSRSVPGAAVVVLCAATTAWGPPAAAAPRPVHPVCGQAVTTDVRLNADLVCPAGGGLVVAADGVDVNLNGHAIVGPLRPGPPVRVGEGIRVRASGVVVRNGEVRGWNAGVWAGIETGGGEGAPGSAEVRGVHLTGNGAGASAWSRGELTLRSTRLTGNSTGASAVFGGRLRVEGALVERNDRGVYMFEAADAVVVRDAEVRRNRVGIWCHQSDPGLLVERTRLSRNGSGIDVERCGASRVHGAAFVWNTRHLFVWNEEEHPVTVTCSSATRDGGPLPVPVGPCGGAPPS
ncbi:hypothetical protein NUM3379_05420 [Kineococcus sp. NUM-3379]